MQPESSITTLFNYGLALIDAAQKLTMITQSCQQPYTRNPLTPYLILTSQYTWQAFYHILSHYLFPYYTQ